MTVTARVGTAVGSVAPEDGRGPDPGGVRDGSDVQPAGSETSGSGVSGSGPGDEAGGTALLRPLAEDPGEPAHLEALTGRLAASAEREGSLDVSWRTLDTPVGSLLLAATELGLVRVAFENEDADAVLAELAARIGARVLRASVRLEPVVVELAEYFEGRRRRFDLALDLRLSSAFRRRVQQRLPGIGYGSTATYAELAVAVGNPGAVRAVGSACATTPIPVVVPCHRVVRSDGTVGGYRGGPAAKQLLLALEGSHRSPTGVVSGAGSG